MMSQSYLLVLHIILTQEEQNTEPESTSEISNHLLSLTLLPRNQVKQALKKKKSFKKLRLKLGINVGIRIDST